MIARSTLRRTLPVAGALLALLPTGCGWLFHKGDGTAGGNNTGVNTSVAANTAMPFPPLPMPTTAPAAPGGQLQAGQYEFRVRNELLSATGFPDTVLEGLRRQLSTASTTTQRCVAPQEAQSPDFGLGQGLRAANCDPRGLQNVGGRLSGQVACSFNGVPATGTINGLVTRDSIFFQLTVSAQQPGDLHSLQLRTEVNGSRTGDCTAGGGFPPPGQFPPPGGGMSPPPPPPPPPGVPEK